MNKDAQSLGQMADQLKDLYRQLSEQKEREILAHVISRIESGESTVGFEHLESFKARLAELTKEQ